MKKGKKHHIPDVLIYIVIGVFGRILPHAPNMTPVGSIALFAGAQVGVAKAFIILLSTMLITDLFIGLHPVMWATYGSFGITIILGHLIGKSRNVPKIASAVFVSSLVFFLLTNFAVWMVPGSMYPKTFQGLIECYGMALPFFRNSILGDMIYSILLFGGFELVKILRHTYKVQVHTS